MRLLFQRVIKPLKLLPMFCLPIPSFSTVSQTCCIPTNVQLRRLCGIEDSRTMPFHTLGSSVTEPFNRT